MPRLPRPHMSLSVKLAACLDALNLTPGKAKMLLSEEWTLGERIEQCLEWLGFGPDDEIEWDHTWALGLRERTKDGGIQVKVTITIEIEGGSRPACIIETISRFYAA